MAFRLDFSWEFLSADEIAAKSVRAVRNHIKHVKEVSPYYKEVLKDIDPEDIVMPEDIARLPLTNRESLVSNTGKFWAVSHEEVVETVVTSGSTGCPLIFFLTESDLNRLAYNEALSFHGAGITAKDRAQIMVHLDRLSINGMAYYRGLTQLKSNTARIGVLPFDMQKHFFQLLKPTVLVGSPSYILRFGQALSKAGIAPQSSSVQKIICAGERLRHEDMRLNSVGTALQELFDARVFGTYSTTELSVTYGECSAQRGNHSHPELVYTEIVDENGNPVPDGTPGELVGTPLGVEAVPLLRYRTGDITFKVKGDCTCGRNSMRIGPILTPKSQVITLNGTEIYPLTLTSALDELEYIEDYLIIVEGENSSSSDDISLHVVTHPSRVPPIAAHLRTCAQVNIPILVSNKPTINALRKGSQKSIKILDKRKKKA